MHRNNLFAGLMAAALLVVAGCSTQKGPATEAVTAAETALGAIREEAARYLPADLQGAEATLTSLKDTLAKKDYKAVLASAPALMTTLATLKDSVAARKVEFDAATAEWGTLSADLPNMVSAIQSRVDVLSSSKRLPKNLSKDSFDAAKAGLDMMKSTWDAANADFTAGNPIDAVAKAKTVQAKGAEVLALLGMTSG